MTVLCGREIIWPFKRCNVIFLPVFILVSLRFSHCCKTKQRCLGFGDLMRDRVVAVARCEKCVEAFVPPDDILHVDSHLLSIGRDFIPAIEVLVESCIFQRGSSCTSADQICGLCVETHLDLCVVASPFVCVGPIFCRVPSCGLSLRSLPVCVFLWCGCG